MIRETITIVDNGLIERLKNTPEIAEEEARTFLETVLAYLQRLVQLNTPIGTTGLLRRSIKTDIYGEKINMRGVVFPSAETAGYAEPVEEGTEPHWAPIGPLKLWAQRKFGDPDIAYAIRGKIAKKGTKGAHMFKKAIERSKPFIDQERAALAERIARRIEQG